MKKIILLAAAAAMFASCAQKPHEGYTVNIKFEGDTTKISSDSIFITNMSQDTAMFFADTAVIANNQANFEGIIDTPQNLYIMVKNEQRPIASLFLENTNFDVTITLGDKMDVKINGGETQKLIDSLNTMSQNLANSMKLDSLMGTYYDPKATPEAKKAVEDLFTKFQDSMKVMQEGIIKANPTSFYALDNLVNNIEDVQIDSAEAQIARFKALPAFAKNKNIKKVEDAIATLKALQPGQIAPDFTQNDPEGNPVKFSDVYKANKVTMVDFWASWCGPCRAFNPTLTKIFAKYKDKGFGIISVSLDKEKEAWVKAIKDDKLDWTHVSDLGFWDNVVAKQYNVRFVPQNIFVDSEGKIIKRHASEEEIETLLEEQLNKK